MSGERYVPAAGRRFLAPLFDPVMAVTTRAHRWRGRLVAETLATDPMTILDLGCGTGTLAVLLAQRAPRARVIGLDGDSEILQRAAAKAEAAGVAVELLEAMADAIPLGDATVDAVVSSLVFHHLAPETKARALAEISRVLRPGGKLIIADYGRPQDPLTRIAFVAVQLLDGSANTRQHAAGELPRLIANAGFKLETIDRLRTLTGTLELHGATHEQDAPVP